MTIAPAQAPVRVEGLHLIRHGASGPEDLVTDLSFDLPRGSALALVGESGSGKSLSALAIMGLLPQGVQVAGGTVSLFGQDSSRLSKRDWRRLRGTRLAMIFQDPMTSLDPCFKVGAQIVETILAHEDISRADARARAIELLEQVQIPDPQARLHAYPHELSGGLRQRVMIAAALALRPEILIADEPTTALDVTTQAAIVSLVDDLRRDLDLGVLWITHDLGVVSQLADRVAVLYAGEMVECATKDEIFAAPRHPYTVGLIDSARVREPGIPFGLIKGSVPEPGAWPTGCRFAPRCPIAQDACATHPLASAGEEHMTRCHFPGKAVLQ
ncbi:MAG: ABC transporter ATP-binding protein [Actinomycetales bacterium]|nr:ABC transporter ATP-binding protein [Actinomycetales bacterium]